MTHAELIEKYPRFIYHSYEIIEDEDSLHFHFEFEIENLAFFRPKSKIAKKDILNKEYDKKFLENLVFHLGLVEMLSYYKLTASKEIVIKAGYLSAKQVKFFQKLLYHGLGEFFYTNNIETSIDDVKFVIESEKEELRLSDAKTSGNLILVGGGKDSCVSLELLKGQENAVFLHNPKEEMRKIANIAEINDEKIIVFERTLDQELLNLNQKSFLNGHTPLSALLAFESYIIAYLRKIKYIVLSNEASANEATVLGTDINHQYSKSFDFELDFALYTKEYFSKEIHYFSLLRSLNEYQITLLFSKYPKYHSIFKSCNLGSKKTPWIWCCKCSKCLFVYILLYSLLNPKELRDIFGEDLLDNPENLSTFKEIIGETGVKPFDCVGTIEDAKYALSKSIKNSSEELPYLLKYYQEHHELLELEDYEHYLNKEHLIPKEFEELVSKELAKYVWEDSFRIRE